MGYDFTKLSEVEYLNEVPDNAKVLIETNDEIKRCPAKFGGGGGIEWIDGVEILPNPDPEEEGFIVTGPTDKSPSEFLEMLKNGMNLGVCCEFEMSGSVTVAALFSGYEKFCSKENPEAFSESIIFSLAGATSLVYCDDSGDRYWLLDM